MSATDTHLACAGTYRRTIRAGLDRVWENVFDWEHLPALHEQDFHAVELLDSGSWGWRVRLINQPGDPSRAQVIAMSADKRAHRYNVVTLHGPGKGSEIRTTLSPRSRQSTGVAVEFFVPRGVRDLPAIAQRYREIYTRLWDQDEAMMMRRARVLARRRRSRRSNPRRKVLGPVDSVRARVPLIVEFGGEPFRIVELEGALVAHAATCPHWLGPLDEAAVVDGCIRCPWHGYKFDIRTGASVDGRNFMLPRPPQVVVQSGVVSLR
jgi:nitrite reductase/ring-hydroxylating ferredoxin subunit